MGLKVYISRQNKSGKVYIKLQENFTLVSNNFGDRECGGGKCVYPDAVGYRGI